MSFLLNKNDFEWSRKYMKLISMLGEGTSGTRDTMSMFLGMISIFSWCFAEIPQIYTHYKYKSTEGISITFIFTWILGDFLNVFGCLLEPSTLPTQLYMAISYTCISTILATQSVYYKYFYNPMNSDKQNDEVVSVAAEDFSEAKFPATVSANVPIPLPAQETSNGGELYCTSARYFSMSHNRSVGSNMLQRMTPENDSNSTTVPLLDRDVPPVLSPSPGIKPMLCLVFYLTFFLAIFNFQKSSSTGIVKVFQAPKSIGKKVGRKLLQANEVSVRNTSSFMDGYGIGSLLGWGMAAVYLGGRLPQIILNIKRGNVEGLNPLMFLLALLGNITYMASILFKSTNWSHLRPNLPWLVDAGGCVFLDTFIVTQFIYFRFWVPQTGGEIIYS